MADGKRTSTGDCDNNVVLDAKEENGQHQKECRNIEDPYIEAVGYLEEHKILEIFQALTSRIIYSRPENPLDFIMEELLEQKEALSS